MPIKTILWAAVFPSAVVGVALILLSVLARRVTARVERSPAPTTAWSILSALALAGTFAFGSYEALGKWPPFPPLAGEEWLPYLALAAAPLAGVLAVLSGRRAVISAGVIAALLAGAVVFLSLANAGDMGVGIARLPWAAGIILYIVVLGTLIELAARKHDDTARPTVGAASLPLALGAAGLLSFPAFALLENVKEGMMMGVLGGTLVAIGVSQLIWLWRFYIRGLGPAFAALYAGLWLTLTFYSSTPNWPAAILGLAAPFPPIVLALIPRLSGPTSLLARRPLIAALSHAMLAAGVIGGAIAIAIASGALKPQTSPYEPF
ncbi:MAG: hypothetical protein AABZ53_07260 [Planctomycetota bacterium]